MTSNRNCTPSALGMLAALSCLAGSSSASVEVRSLSGADGSLVEDPISMVGSTRCGNLVAQPPQEPWPHLYPEVPNLILNARLLDLHVVRISI